jgi:glycerol-3-phosphate acyltransferase PlsY
MLGYIVAAIAAYLLGSIPTGFLVAKARGVDIRTVGSGNIGATNVFRALGKRAGVFVLLVDVLKGYVACRFVGDWAPRLFSGSGDLATHEYFLIVAGFCAVLGHNFTCWLYFKGGKGIATSAGVLLALFPQALLVVLVIWAVVFALGRYVSLASITAAFWLPVFVSLFGYSGQRVVVAIVMAALAIYQHKTNIQRLMAGTENRFGDKKPDPAAALPPQ